MQVSHHSFAFKTWKSPLLQIVQATHRIRQREARKHDSRTARNGRHPLTIEGRGKEN